MATIFVGVIDWARSCKRAGRFATLFNVYRWLRSILSNIENGCRFSLFFISVTLRLPWAYSYFWMGRYCRHELLRLIDSDDYRQDTTDKMYHKAYNYLSQACCLRANFVDAAKHMSAIAVFSGRYDAWLEAQQRIIEYQECRADLAGVEVPNIRLFDARPIYSTIGCIFTLDAWIKSGLLGLRPECRSLVLVDPALKEHIANQCLLDYLKLYFEFIEDPDEISRLEPLAGDLVVPHDYYLHCGEKIFPYPHAGAVWLQAEWTKRGHQPLFVLTEEHRERGWNALVDLGMPRDGWFVTTHVRQSGFKGQESYRDSSISTYLDAYREVTEQGGWVIRLGDSSMPPLPSMPRVIDYALSPVKSDWMDVFLLAAARFMIGSSSGPTGISYIFGVPIAMTNNLPTAATYLTQQDLFLPRLMRRIDDGRLLNLEELMARPYNLACWDTIYSNVLGVETIPNTADEITALVKEMLAQLDKSLVYTEEDEDLQHRFKTLTADREVMIGVPGFEIQCRLGNYFLRKHEQLLG
jgi:putative glycosyltransferase (TIGR04372 family)